MKKHLIILTVCLIILSIGLACKDKFSEKTMYPAFSEKTMYPTYKGLVLAGYQGWFIQQNGQMYPNQSSIRIDFWPDMKEYEKSYPTCLKYADSTVATFFSATDKSTIDLHFKWMKDYGVDGVFMQRFYGRTRKGNNPSRKIYATMLSDALDAASKYERAIAVEYDLSGLKPSEEDCSTIIEDWKFLVDSIGVLEAEREKTYLHHNGRPLVGIWGLGFPDRPYNIRDIGFDKLVDLKMIRFTVDVQYLLVSRHIGASLAEIV